MTVNIEINEAGLKKIVLEAVQRQLGPDNQVSLEDIKIETKSTQNYRAEWETAKFRATITRDL